MASIARGTFDVSLKPQSLSDVAASSGLGRLSIDKKFSGDLTGTSTGEMLSVMGTVKGSAGYVAIETVNGSLNGRAGTFSLMHTGIMDKGSPSLTVSVVPDSGTGGLTGISGTLTIDIIEKVHHYTFTYTLPA